MLLRRRATASRCQVDGRELRDELRLTRQELYRGVPILLAHAVVLLLHLGEPAEEPPPARSGEYPLVGSGWESRQLQRQVQRVAATDVDVLIRGATGTGKELVARAIHAGSDRAGAELVCVNMAAIPAALAPALLFGSARGAYTGAERATRGYFQQADGGTPVPGRGGRYAHRGSTAAAAGPGAA